MRKLTTFAAAVSLFAAAQASAVIVFDNDAQEGSQSGYLLGMDFEVHSTIRVTEMGIFDSKQDGFSSLLNVGIFRLDTLSQATASTLVAGSAVSFGGNTGDGVLDGGSRFKDVTDFLLGPGYYSIVAAGFTSVDKSGNTGVNNGSSGNGVITFNDLGGTLGLTLKGGRWTSTGNNILALPTAHYGVNTNYTQSDPVFQAGTFKAEKVDVPDTGSTFALLGLGFLGLIGLRRRLFA